MATSFFSGFPILGATEAEQQTSPFTGVPGVRYDETPGSGPETIVFSGKGGSEQASGYIAGFMRPGGEKSAQDASGLLPSFLFNYTGGTQKLGDVSLALSPGEESLVANHPETFRRLSAFMGKWGPAVYFLVFVAALTVAAKYARR